MTTFIEPLSDYIWNNKYRYQFAGKVIDATIEDTFQRVAKAVAKVEKPQLRKQWQQQFLKILTDFKFLPGGRILAGAGTKHQVTLFNCFVMGQIEDDMKSIFNHLKEGALTLQQGGGIGYDFSSLRPRGSLAKRTGAVASGPVSFMRIWDSMSATMQSTGARRGAMMATLRCDHPDIEEFIAAKADAAELRQFNVSVLVTDAFMDAVNNNESWPLVFPVLDGQENDETIERVWSGSDKAVPCKVYKRINARSLWESIIQAAYQYAEPGVIFIDTINNWNNLWYCETISATNPCGEIPLPWYGECNLGAINLTQFINHPFTETAAIDWHALEHTVQVATRFLDNIIDLSRYPLPAQKKRALANRRIGLGFTGLADALLMLNQVYGSEAAARTAAKLMQVISHTTWQTSCELAREKGAFPEFDAEKYCAGQFVQALPDTLQTLIKQHGVRNSHHNTIAPTGTISLLANNISSGIEPIFANEYIRHIRSNHGELETYQVKSYTFHLWQQLGNKESLPEAWIDAQNLTPEAHLRMQIAVQPFIDNAISKTIYIPEDCPFVKVQDIYTQAYQNQLKGCTIYRPNPTTGSVITTQSVEGNAEHCCSFTVSNK